MPLRAATHLRTLRLDPVGTQVIDVKLAFLAHLTCLEELHLGFKLSVSEADFVAAAPGLQRVTLWAVDDAAWTRLTARPLSWTRLALHNPVVPTAPVLRTQFPQLTSLRVGEHMLSAWVDLIGGLRALDVSVYDCTQLHVLHSATQLRELTLANRHSVRMTMPEGVLRTILTPMAHLHTLVLTRVFAKGDELLPRATTVHTLHVTDREYIAFGVSDALLRMSALRILRLEQAEGHVRVVPLVRNMHYAV
jgi:hypothetical protein